MARDRTASDAPSDVASDALHDAGVDADGSSCPVPCAEPAPTCVDGTCKCVQLARQCSGNSVQTCCWDNGDWCGVPVPCPGQTCIAGACAGVCSPAQTQCMGNGVQTCQANGQWGTAVACGDAAPLCSGGRCGDGG